jgi:hypothetical protein
MWDVRTMNFTEAAVGVVIGILIVFILVSILVSGDED